MMPNAEKTYQAIRDLTVREPFTLPKSHEGVITNPAQILLSRECGRILSLCLDNDEAEKYGKMSDYERLELFISRLPDMCGSAAYELFFAGLEAVFGYSASEEGIDAKHLWKKLSEDISFENYNIYGTSDNVRIYPTLDISAEYDTLVLKNTEAIQQDDSEYIAVDMSKYHFEVTDSYHARQAWRAYALDKDTKSISTAVSGLMYHICESAKKSNKCLYIYIGKDNAQAEKMLDYFADRGILPNVRIFADTDAILETCKRLCGRYQSGDCGVLVRCGFVCKEEDTLKSIAEAILSAARIYPIAKLSVVGYYNPSFTAVAGHSIIKKGISKALEKICLSAEDAAAIANKMLSQK